MSNHGRMSADEMPRMLTSLIGAAAPPAEGRYVCNERPRCGNVIDLPGVCRACAERAAMAEFNAALRPAIESIPEQWQWAVPGRAETAAMASDCVHDWDRVGDELADVRDAIAEDHGPRMVVFYGPDGQVGKTSSACLLLRWCIERGRFTNLTDAERKAAISPGVAGASRLAPRPLNELPARVMAARGARYMRTVDLRAATALITPDVIAARKLASTAPILLLDDVGDELDNATVGSHDITNRIAGTRDVIRDRNERGGLLTIVTTYLSRAKMQSFYGGGTTERIYQRARVICVGPNAKREDV